MNKTFLSCILLLLVNLSIFSVSSILVTGGAGFIGSHVAYRMMQEGYHIIILDNTTNNVNHVSWATCIAGDYAEKEKLAELFQQYDIKAVVHCAAYIQVGESVRNPWKYYDNNVSKTLVLLDTMRKYGIRKLIFSSSAAVYGNPQWVPMTEDHPRDPINPYGNTKYMMELICQDFHRAYGLEYVIFRYFNAAGAMPDWGLGEKHEPETHLIPLLLQSALNGNPFYLFGTDYTTKDGTCIRDYIHVYDIAQAHVLALHYLDNGGISDFFNLGTGHGFSVKQVVEMVEKITDKKVNLHVTNRRPGDPPVLIASAKRAKKILGWQPQYPTLEQIVGDAYLFMKK